MLSYEICKSLKDAGFKLSEPHPSASVVSRWFNTETGEDGIEPSLAELIKACGNGFKNLCKGTMGDYWTCNSSSYEVCDGDGHYDLMEREESIGDTPEEAVAELWLKISRK